MVHIIGMRKEGRALGQRIRPTAKVRREYSVVCREPEKGSHVQPVSVCSHTGDISTQTLVAREELLKTLKAFDSGEEERVIAMLPNARERWFMADAAKGLLPPDDEELTISIRPGKRGPFSFRADRARVIIERLREGKFPESEEHELVGKLHTIDYQRTIITVKPGANRAVRFDYPMKIEAWLQANVRKRVRVVGDPNYDQKGDITSFSDIKLLGEIEPSLPAIKSFYIDKEEIFFNKPLSIPVEFDWQNRIFVYSDEELGIDVISSSYEKIRDEILSDLKILWLEYAMAEDEALDKDAIGLKKKLLNRLGRGNGAA